MHAIIKKLKKGQKTLFKKTKKAAFILDIYKFYAIPWQIPCNITANVNLLWKSKVISMTGKRAKVK